MWANAESRTNDGPLVWNAPELSDPAGAREVESSRGEKTPCVPPIHGRGRVKVPVRRGLVVALALALIGCWLAIHVSPARALSADLVKALDTSTYVYVASNRKDGSFGTPAEIWFMYHRGAVWVASPPTTWRVRRIRAGRPKARIAIGKRDGPTFMATGSIVADPAIYEEMFRTFARKYPSGWPKYEERFRTGLADGTRVLVKYDPVD